MAASKTASKSEQQHALAIPLPGQGHINPLMRFCKRLASQEGFTITFVDIQPFVENAELDKQEHDAPAMQADAETAADDARDIRRVRIGMEAPKAGEGTSMIESSFGALQRLAPDIEELVCKCFHEGRPITCLVSDLLMTGPTQTIADKFNIPRIAFNTSSHSFLLFINYLHQGTVSLEEVFKVVVRKEGLKEETFAKKLLGLPTLKNGDLMDYHDANHFVYQFKVQNFEETKGRSHAFVSNSFQELEGHALHVNIGLPTYAVGPLIEPLDESTTTRFWKEDQDCMVWLSEQPFRSVLYVSFGSVAYLSKVQFEEIVAGLISSQQRFLWVFRSNLVKDANYLAFPIDLLSKTQGKGYSIEWAPQLSVLSHPSIGGFLTHCGWNSTIEALSLGVPMLCFPYMSDQFMNSKFIIEQWKVGLGFKICKDSGLVGRDEVERVVQTLMVGEEGKMLQRNANYFKEVSYQNLQPKGTSFKNMQALVLSLR